MEDEDLKHIINRMSYSERVKLLRSHRNDLKNGIYVESKKAFLTKCIRILTESIKDDENSMSITRKEEINGKYNVVQLYYAAVAVILISIISLILLKLA